MPAPASDMPRLDLVLSDLVADKDLVLCDVWGVIHNGVRRHEPAVDALCRFRGAGGTVILITNAPAPEANVRSRLDRLGVPHDAYDRIATSGDVAAGIIAAAGCPPLFTIGPDRELAIYREAKRLGGRMPLRAPIATAALAVCVGLDATGDRPEDYDGVLGRLRERDLDLVCANPDIVVEAGDELIFCAGAIAERYASIGGKVIQAGKPHAAIYARAFAMAEAIRGPTQTSRMLAIGDAVATDIAGAAAQGIASLLITAGIHRALLHGGSGDLAIDEGALAHFLGDHQARPMAAMTRLRWTA